MASDAALDKFHHEPRPANWRTPLLALGALGAVLGGLYAWNQTGGGGNHAAETAAHADTATRTAAPGNPHHRRYPSLHDGQILTLADGGRYQYNETKDTVVPIDEDGRVLEQRQSNGS